MSEIKIKLLDHYDQNLPLPQYETTDAAGADIRACLENRDTIIIKPGQRVLIPTGLSFEIASGHEVQVRPRSGLSLKTNLLVVNSPGTIDADYRGEVKVILGNFGQTDEVIHHGDRIAQIVLAPITQAKFLVSDKLSQTSRGSGGFGSTGTK
ncbi:MAG: dUTP diphosphatase [Bacteriovoracaceae bacterium]|jgi:dUTP pyrophosphatase|nr:dUTP diphosphatase [Halobacteriovoraceae bacterium]MDP7320902.1 dUTP diphosphatase [Bacteriovoracaceae bacterium]|tara:strand:+ start:235 stop:690 length:456 start_codon:yes stop_codon:yes gene_type:complete